MLPSGPLHAGPAPASPGEALNELLRSSFRSSLQVFPWGKGRISMACGSLHDGPSPKPPSLRFIQSLHREALIEATAPCSRPSPTLYRDVRVSREGRKPGVTIPVGESLRVSIRTPFQVFPWGEGAYINGLRLTSCQPFPQIPIPSIHSELP